MDFIKKCLKGNGTIRATIIITIVMIKLIPIFFHGLMEEQRAHEAHYTKVLNEWKGGAK